MTTPLEQLKEITRVLHEAGSRPMYVIDLPDRLAAIIAKMEGAQAHPFATISDGVTAELFAQIAINTAQAAEIAALKGAQAAVTDVHVDSQEMRDTITAQSARITSPESEVKGLRADAERYRWLRNESGNDLDAPYAACDHGPHKDTWLTGAHLDEALDAARQSEPT